MLFAQAPVKNPILESMKINTGGWQVEYALTNQMNIIKVGNLIDATLAESWNNEAQVIKSFETHL